MSTFYKISTRSMGNVCHPLTHINFHSSKLSKYKQWLFLLRKNNKKLAELLVRFSINQKKNQQKFPLRLLFTYWKFTADRSGTERKSFWICAFEMFCHHCMKNVRIRNFSGPFFLAFGVENLRIRTLFTKWILLEKVMFRSIQMKVQTISTFQFFL